jgi:type IV secretion system protein VirB6
MDAEALGLNAVTVVCSAPNPDVAVAVRLSDYLDCQARALGENGFQALAGGPVVASLLSGLVTIFIALIGYRLILGQAPGLRNGIGWAVRLGLVLAFVTSWPAFQTVVFRVAVDGPVELAQILLPAAGLPAEGMETRIQNAYDTMRLGVTSGPPNIAGTNILEPGGLGQARSVPQLRSTGPGYPPLPQTASLLVISTLGVMAAFKVAIGLLLAIGPLAIMSLLFDAMLGVFGGWVRALLGSVLGLLAATTVTAIDMIAVESQFAHIQRYTQGLSANVVDSQALTTIVLFFAVIVLVVTWAAARTANAFRLPFPASIRSAAGEGQPAAIPSAVVSALQATQQPVGATATVAPVQARAMSVANALAATVRREQVYGSQGSAPEAPSRRVGTIQTSAGPATGTAETPLGMVGRHVAGRRSTGRRTRSAMQRDKLT